MGKSRVAPLKRVSVPRLELVAAVLAVKMSTMISREVDIKYIFGPMLRLFYDIFVILLHAFSHLSQVVWNYCTLLPRLSSGGMCLKN